MNIFAKALKVLVAKLQVDAVKHPRADSWFTWLLPNTAIDFAKHVGDGMGSNVFMSPVLWVWRASLESRLTVVTEDGKGDGEADLGHPLVQLMSKPNPFVSGMATRLAMMVSWFTDGNAYFLKARDGTGQVRQLWYVPHWMIEPKQNPDDQTSFISYYCYTPGGGVEQIELAPSEVVHLKHGQDPRDIRKGFSYMKMLLREIFNDDEAANFVAALLLNGGVPGIVISPKDANSASEESLKATKDYIKVNFGRSKRGAPLALGAPTEVKEFGYDPAKMDLSAVRNVAEERVCAGVGLPAAVVGLGSGMEQTSVGATLIELHRIAWIGCVIPNQDLIAEELTRELGKDFKLGANQRVGWDRRKVRALQDDMNKETDRYDVAIRGGWVMVSEGRQALGLPVDDSHKIFLRSFAQIEVPEGQLASDVKPEPDPNTQPSGFPPKKGAKVAKARLTRRQQIVLRAMDSVKRASAKRLEARMETFFREYGRQVQEAYAAAVAKAAEDEVAVELLFGSINVNKMRQELRGIYGTHYVGVFRDTKAALAGLEIGLNMPDSVELNILSRGGTQAGLVDLTTAGRKRALDIVREGRAAGRNPVDVARDLAEAVPAGPFKSSRTRAEIIARSETRVAQTESAMLAYRNSSGIDQVMIIDGRLGDTDEDCEQANGQVVSFQDADALLASEHPNGTRDVVPMFAHQES